MKAECPLLEIVTLSDTGQVREHNEDFLAEDAQAGIVVLADGMGGYQAGEVASEIAATRTLETIRAGMERLVLHEIDPKSGYRHASLLLQQAVLKANQAIYLSAQQNQAHHGMGTTIVAALFYRDRISIAHVGDSRLYRLRGDSLETLTTDHSVLQELIEHGFYTQEQARHAPNRNLVTRALGVNLEVKVDLTELRVQTEDIYLFCSDGLNDMLDDTQISDILRRYRQHLSQAAVELIAAANAHGGHDNVSVILARRQEQRPAPAHWLQRLWRGLRAPWR